MEGSTLFPDFVVVQVPVNCISRNKRIEDMKPFQVKYIMKTSFGKLIFQLFKYSRKANNSQFQLDLTYLSLKNTFYVIYIEYKLII